jgi:methylglutaconyl-CoA hydratase
VSTDGAGIAVERRGAAAWVWLDRPEIHNAFGAETIAALHRAFDQLAADDGVRCVVLAGRGRSFSAGADVNWMRASLDLSAEENVADAERLSAMLLAVDACPKPVVARVHGAALGGGSGLVACCDVALAAERATFGFTETRLGLIPAVISPFAVPRIGISHARALFLSGERFDARRALHIGLVHQVLPDEEALDAAVEWVVGELLSAAPLAVAHAKRLLAQVAGHDPASLRRLTAEAIAERRASPEGQEGLRAFLERREPGWRA